MLLTTTTTIVATTTVGSAIATTHHTRSKKRRFFHKHTSDRIVPINSNLHETSVIRSLAKGLHQYDADYLVASLQILSTALQTHHELQFVPADVLLDAFIPMIRRHCRLPYLRKRVEAIANSGLFTDGSEQAYACCIVSSAVHFLTNEATMHGTTS